MNNRKDFFDICHIRYRPSFCALHGFESPPIAVVTEGINTKDSRSGWIKVQREMSATLKSKVWLDTWALK